MHPLIVNWICPSIDTHHQRNYAYFRSPKNERPCRNTTPPAPRPALTQQYSCSPTRKHLACGKITVFLCYEWDQWNPPRMPEPQMMTLVLMIRRQAAQGNLKICPHSWSRWHLRWCSCEPYTTQLGHRTQFTDLHVLHLAEQGTAHSIASRKRISLSPHTHTCLSSSYRDATTKIYQLSFQSCTRCGPVGISTSWKMCQFVHR